MESFLNQVITKNWGEILDNTILLNIIKELDIIYKEKTVYPKKSKVFKMFQLLEHDKIKVVILGQDPYSSLCTKTISNESMDPEPYAQGMAFSVGENMKPPKSLEIILNSISEQFYYGMQIPLPSPNLDRWIEQGVFLLNTSLTVEANTPNSHKKLWEDFTKNFLLTLSAYNPNVIYLLWGKEAQQFQKYISSGFVLKDIHPNAVSYNKDLKFNGGFNECNNLLKSLNSAPIVW